MRELGGNGGKDEEFRAMCYVTKCFVYLHIA